MPTAGGAVRTGDQFFDAHPLIIEQIILSYESDGLKVYAESSIRTWFRLSFAGPVYSDIKYLKDTC